MATDNWDACYAFTLGAEGGYSTDPNDPGNWTGCSPGAGVLKGTNKGISACAYPDLDIKNLTDDQIQDIYHRDYWDKVGGDDLPKGVDLVTWDAGVNSGPAKGVQWLQQATGAAVDGICGPQTIACAQKADPHFTIDTVCNERLAFLKTLSTWGTYGTGWTNRINACRDTAHSMVAAAPAPPVPAELVVIVTAPKGVKVQVNYT